MSRRAPASTIVISALAAGGNDGHRRALRELHRLLGLTERAVAVGHDRQVGRGAVHPLGRAQVRERLGVVPRGVRRLAGRLAHDRQPRGPRPGGERVPVGGLGVLVDQHPGGGQVPGDPGGELLREPLELGRHRAVELGAGDVLGQVRAVVLLLLLGPRRVCVLSSCGRFQSPDRAGRPPLAGGLPPWPAACRRLCRRLARRLAGGLPPLAVSLAVSLATLLRPGRAAVLRHRTRLGLADDATRIGDPAAPGQPERLLGLLEEVARASGPRRRRPRPARRAAAGRGTPRRRRAPGRRARRARCGSRRRRRPRPHPRPRRRPPAGRTPCSRPGRAAGRRGWRPRPRGAGLDAAAGVVGAQHALGHDRQPGLLGEPDQVVRPEVERLLGTGRVLVARVEVDPEQLGVDDVPDDLVAGGVLRARRPGCRR